MGLLLSARSAEGFSDDPVHTDVVVEWSQNDLSITNNGDEVDVLLELRLVHGVDDITWIAESVRLGEGDGVTVEVEWPDLSAKGPQLGVPATIQGYAFVSTLEGESRGPRGVPRRLVMLGSSPAVHETSELMSLLPPSLLPDVEEDDAVLAGVDPAVLGE